MKPIGNSLCSVIVLLLVLTAPAAFAAVTAEIDRNRVTLGDSLRLTITATDNEEINDSDLEPLLADFEIMQRSASNSTSIINGRMSRTRQMIIDLAPLREGDLVIPALHIGGSTTPPITIGVGPASDSHTDGEKVVFEAEVDRESVYVQGQIILTLRAQQAVSLDERSITQLKLDGAFVKPLEQHSFQRTINGQPWLVHEMRYAIFPEQSGALEIPAQTFAGRLNQARRSFFGHGGGGKLIRRSTRPITVNVLPKPDSFGPTDWLPARQLTLEEDWSTPPEQLRVGESATRTIRIVGEGLQGAQLPPVLFSPIDGLKYYPDQPQISEQETATGLQGIRQDSAAVVPTRAGTYVIPEIRIPWWDTQQGKVQLAVLPERRLTVLAAEPPHAPASESAAALAAESASAGSSMASAAATPGSMRFWQGLAGLSVLGWLLTLLYFLRKRNHSRPEAPTDPLNANARQTLKQLLTACAANDASGARAAVIRWAASLDPKHGIVSLDQVSGLFSDEELNSELKALNASLYRPGTHPWEGDTLARCARRLQTARRTPPRPSTERLSLYPQ
jgi:hypothetical protein